MKVCGVKVSAKRWVNSGLGIGLAALVAAAASPASARTHHYYPRHASADAYNPAFSAIVVDATSGREVYGVNENALRHPASITKVMTLYLLFEQLEKGAMTLDTPIRISEHAAAQEPSKLGIAAGDSLTAEEAIKAVVTRSANDVAVAIAEAVGGNESAFAELMTRKAHSLGMSRTIYRNASGLPNDEQVTTARDLTVLARSLEDRFPQYFKYFSTHEFVYDGEVIGNHNHLLGQIDGVDGIKTGYTRASGFNLLTSVHRDGRALLAVVMGGRSAASRDHIMEGLIATHIAECSNHGKVSTMLAAADPTPAPSVASGTNDPRRGASVSYAVASADAPKSRPVVKANDQGEGDSADDEETAAPPKTVVATTPKLSATKANVAPPPAPQIAAAQPPAPVAKRVADANPAALGWKTGPKPVSRPESKPPQNERASEERAKSVPPKEETRVVRSSGAADSDVAHKGWIIQIGASDNAGKAMALLSRAQSHNRALADARPFTEKFVKGGDTYFRARFAGLDSDKAEQACRTLKRDGIPCFATHVD